MGSQASGQPGSSPQSVLVVVPTYDERVTIRVLLDRLLAEPRHRLSVLVVDDASPDGTGDLVRALGERDPRIHLRSRPAKLGLGSAYREAFTSELAGGFDVLCQMDADLSHDPAQLADLLAPLDEGADAVIGSRYVPGGRIEGWPRHRLLLSRGGNLYVRLLTGCPVRDVTSGFRAFRSEALPAIDVGTVQSEGYGFQIEVTLRAWQAGLAVQEVPITFTERAHGASKLSGSIVREAILRTVRWAYRIRRGRPLA